MNILVFKDLKVPAKLKAPFSKVKAQLSNGDFRSAEVKKISNTPYFRAKIDYANRLLFNFGSFNNQTYLLFLKLILNHEYEKSKFLRGYDVDESKLINIKKEAEVNKEDTTKLVYVNESQQKFHFLDKVISFDENQQEIYDLPTL